jgi:hypothetical protein
MKQGGLIRQNVARYPPPVRDRIIAVNYRLRMGEDKALLMINPVCKYLIRDLERVKWKEGALGVIDKSDPDLTHASDALGYFIHREYPIAMKPPRRTRVAEIVKRTRNR